MASLRTVGLARHLALAYLVLVVYASLYPFSGWRDTGVSPMAFLGAAWPRYWTGFDLAVNVGAYLPLGFLLALALDRLPGRATPPLVAALLAAATSFALETLQNWLPSRVPWNVDLACNAAGGLAGALLAFWLGQRVFERAAEIERGLLAPVPRVDLGVSLIALWLLAQLSPETLLFGSGDLRRLFGEFNALPYAADQLLALETAVTGCNMLAIGLLARQLIARSVFALPPLFLLFVSALCIRAVAAAVIAGPGEAFAWMTAGAMRGLGIGSVALLVVALFPEWLRLSIASLALLGGTVAVNLAPESPYRLVVLAAWQQGHFLNFNGLTRVVAVIWPFLALPYLTLLARRSGS